MATNRKRTANFTFKEEQFLINLIEKYQDNLENKKTDAGSNSQKNAAWIKIENEFNTLNGEPYRDRKVLKKKYENMKKATKKKLADHKCEINSTGGGPSKKIELTDIDDKIKCILGNRIQSFPSQSCSDSENHIGTYCIISGGYGRGEHRTGKILASHVMLTNTNGFTSLFSSHQATVYITYTYVNS